MNYYERCEKCYDLIYYNMKSWCIKCRIKSFKENFINWTSGNEKIDKFIQGRQLKIDRPGDIVFEWIPYNHFYNIKEVGKHDVNIVYLALWENGPLDWIEINKKYIRTSPDKKVILKCLRNLHDNIIDGLLNEINEIYESNMVYGISQNPNTKEYIMVLNAEYSCEKCYRLYSQHYEKWCKSCQINYFKENFTYWTSGNDIIDKYIQEMQLNIIDYKSIIFEWIPYNHFNNIKEVGRNDFTTICLASWENGPLSWRTWYTRDSRYKVGLKYLHNSHNNIDEFLKEISKV
ncbi:hypothetical protein C1646_315640 [Rhizophagus diaphanus]|nr:hypothetical protein C1646_315640 [Rhizophagus diaphanus] [Rhizophagus sp. MUCL 43196]